MIAAEAVLATITGGALASSPAVVAALSSAVASAGGAGAAITSASSTLATGSAAAIRSYVGLATATVKLNKAIAKDDIKNAIRIAQGLGSDVRESKRHG